MIYPIDTYTQQVVDEASSTVTYIGTTKPGIWTNSAQWQIQKINSTTNPTTIEYPQLNGIPNAGFFFIWDNRASYTYSLS
jgi:hypothetical protein